MVERPGRVYWVAAQLGGEISAAHVYCPHVSGRVWVGPYCFLQVLSHDVVGLVFQFYMEQSCLKHEEMCCALFLSLPCSTTALQETWLNFQWGQVYDSMDEVQPAVSKKKVKNTGGDRGGCEGMPSSSRGVQGLGPDLVKPAKPSKAEVAAWVEMTAQRIEETAPLKSLKQPVDMIGPKEGQVDGHYHHHLFANKNKSRADPSFNEAISML